ncbi:MAG: hypothetical protein H6999_00800 [Hahellaceae bacterium]|nr:hypothetical protein [Hahellaceae bacterium]MCP5168289.1 hypothetical protein [Hahellaceae bacterium]
MIDPIEVVGLESMFEQWLSSYRYVLRRIANPYILVDDHLPGYLELISELDIALERYKVSATVCAISADNIHLTDVNLVLCITTRNSMVSALAKVRIYGVTKNDVGQVWELSENHG